ncbi:MAG: molecular chaperone TorD family protein [Lentisphaeria bacterium]|jgi:TorA maturation chaperone TorD|nr:molecular chaperone TorD family protein [Lentisphaeria bacterium]
MNLSANYELSDQAATMSNDRADDSWILDRARLAVYQFLSLAGLNPHSERWPALLDPRLQELTTVAVELIREDPSACVEALAPGELPSQALDLQPLISCSQQPRDSLIEEYDHVFGLLISKECPPYETEYCPQTFSVYRSQHLADIAGYYRAFGLEPSPQHPERQDHIVLELEFMAWLIAKARYAADHGDEDNAGLCRDAQVSFFRDHFAWWTPAFALALRRKADGIANEHDMASPPTTYQGAFGAFLAAFVPAERAVLGIPPPTVLVAPTTDVEEDSEGCETCPLSADPSAAPETIGERT